MSLKKTALMALLVAVTAAAAVVAVKRVQSEINGPPLLMDRKFDKIDVNSLEIFSETLRDWTTKYAADASGRCKNPRTGEYTMVDTMKCASCGQIIPVPQIPADLGPSPELVKARGRGFAKEILALMNAKEEFLRNYKCPKCGKNAFVMPPRPVPPKSK
jgi:rRNA maturation protein Nop10